MVRKAIWLILPVLTALVLCAGPILGSRARADNAREASSAAPAKSGHIDDDSTDRGEQLWSVSCGRCHNRRSPESFSDAEWETVLSHMRSRANLTGEEARQILK